MLKIQELDIDGYDRVIHGYDECFDAYIAVHNINLGVAIGGCRAIEYPTTDDALKDALSLAKGMTYKNAMAGLPNGGGKSVINGLPTEENLMKFAEMMNYINEEGRIYMTGGDMNTGLKQLEFLNKYTEFVYCGGNTDSGQATAQGVYQAIKGAVKALGGDMNKQIYSILGYGKVGKRLSDFMVQDNLYHMVADVTPVNPEDYIPSLRGQASVSNSHFAGNVWIPCAAGGAINDITAPSLPENSLVCGGANNQLAHPDIMRQLEARNVTYVPDYVANAGGVIIIAVRGTDNLDLEYDSPVVAEKLNKIGETVHDIVKESLETGVSTDIIANSMAERIFND